MVPQSVKFTPIQLDIDESSPVDLEAKKLIWLAAIRSAHTRLENSPVVVIVVDRLSSLHLRKDLPQLFRRSPTIECYLLDPIDR